MKGKKVFRTMRGYLWLLSSIKKSIITLGDSSNQAIGVLRGKPNLANLCVTLFVEPNDLAMSKTI